MEGAAVDCFAIIVCTLISFGGVIAGVAAFLIDRRKKQARSNERASLGAELGLSALDAQGGQDRVGGSRNGLEWVVGWEVRKVAGSPPKFVTFFEASGPAIPPAEVRYKLPLTTELPPIAPVGHAVFDEHFQAAGDLHIDAVLADEFASFLRLSDDFYMVPGRIVLVCVGDHKETDYLRARIEAVERLTNRL